MSFKTRYGSNASIRAEPQALPHTESYTPNFINMDCPNLEMNENDIVSESNTSLAEINDFFLDEWASAYQFEPMSETLEIGLSTYCIIEKDAQVPNLVKTNDDMSDIWSMYFDGSRSKNGLGAGVMLISPAQIRYYFSFRLQFSCTNNVAEYQPLIQGLLLAQKRGIQALGVYGDSELVVNQVRNQNITKNGFLKSYKHRVWDFLEGFNAFNIQSIPRKENRYADRLAAIGASYVVPRNLEEEKKQQIRVVVMPTILDNNIHWQVFESYEKIVNFL